jgi:hypothetical protein
MSPPTLYDIFGYDAGRFLEETAGITTLDQLQAHNKEFLLSKARRHYWPNGEYLVGHIVEVLARETQFLAEDPLSMPRTR